MFKSIEKFSEVFKYIDVNGDYHIPRISIEVPKSEGKLQFFDNMSGEEIATYEYEYRWLFTTDDINQKDYLVTEVFDVPEHDSYLVTLRACDAMNIDVLKKYTPTSRWSELLTKKFNHFKYTKGRA
jgi:hypothetical protein